MEKTAIDIDILLPEVPDDSDACVERIIDTIQNRRGIEKVHVLTVSNGDKAKLCFHYDPDEILISEVEKIAKEAGIRITERYGHLLMEVRGVRHPRHARILEDKIKSFSGVIYVSVSGTGFIRLEFDKHRTSQINLIREIQGLGLRITSKKIGEKDYAAGDGEEGIERKKRPKQGMNTNMNISILPSSVSERN